MKKFASKDLYQIALASNMGSELRSYLYDFYLPLLGTDPCAVYCLLLEEGKFARQGASRHDALLAKLGLTQGELFNALSALEAIGLIKTYHKSDPSFQKFFYVLYAPKDPKEFFEDPLFYGMLVKRIGRNQAEALVEKYAQEKPDLSGYEDVSERFTSYFNLDLDDPVYLLRPSKETKGASSGEPQLDFDYGKFVSALREATIDPSSISDSELQTIERYATLYRLDEMALGSMILSCYRYQAPKGEHVDLSTLERLCRESLNIPSLRKEEKPISEVSSDSKLAKKIKMMDEYTPVEYLTALQRGGKPSQSDLRIVNKLSTETGLHDGPINALIDYVLATNDNILSAPLTEKIGASLKRANVLTARDAMDYLSSSKRKKGRKKVEEKPQTPTPEEPESILTETKKEGSVGEEELEAALARLYNKN